MLGSLAEFTRGGCDKNRSSPETVAQQRTNEGSSERSRVVFFARRPRESACWMAVWRKFWRSSYRARFGLFCLSISGGFLLSSCGEAAANCSWLSHRASSRSSHESSSRYVASSFNPHRRFGLLVALASQSRIAVHSPLRYRGKRFSKARHGPLSSRPIVKFSVSRGKARRLQAASLQSAHRSNIFYSFGLWIMWHIDRDDSVMNCQYSIFLALGFVPC